MNLSKIKVEWFERILHTSSNRLHSPVPWTSNTNPCVVKATSTNDGPSVIPISGTTVPGVASRPFVCVRLRCITSIVKPCYRASLCVHGGCATASHHGSFWSRRRRRGVVCTRLCPVAQLIASRMSTVSNEYTGHRHGQSTIEGFLSGRGSGIVQFLDWDSRKAKQANHWC